MLKVFNYEILFVDDISYYITNRDNTDQFFVFQYGQMTDEFITHQLHAFINRVVWIYKYGTLVIISLTSVSFEERPFRITLRA